MDVASDLTLQIICFLQADGDSACVSARWGFVPGPGRGFRTYEEAAAVLSGMQKPVVIGALTHPGIIAVWRPSAVDEGERLHVEHTLANQLGGLEDFLTEFKIHASGIVRFEGLDRHVDVPVPVFRRWLAEHALTWGWNLGAPTDTSHHARLFVMRRFGTWSRGQASGPRR